MMTFQENETHRVFLDTNVIIDAMTMRDYDYLPSRQVWRQILSGNVKGYICSKQITDIYYIFRKYYQSESLVRQNIKNIVDSFEVLPFTRGDALACIKSEMKDFEDAVLCEVAKVNMIPILITNNISHFTNCKMMALTPEQFLKMFSLE